MRRLIAAPLTWLGAILVVTDVRAWLSGSDLGWFAGLATTLIVGAIAILLWAASGEMFGTLVAALVLMAIATSAYLVIGRVLDGEPGGPRIAGALIALAVPLAPVWVIGLLAIGLVLSQSYLAVIAAVIGLAVIRRSWLILSTLPVLLGGVVLARMDIPLLGPRLDTWTRFAWPAFRAHPWNGWGPGAWAPVIESAQMSAGAEYLTGHAHSDLVEWAVEYGVLGLGLVAGFIVAAWPTFVDSPVRGALVTSGVLSLGLHVWHVPFLMPWLALIVALGLRGAVDA